MNQITKIEQVLKPGKDYSLRNVRQLIYKQTGWNISRINLFIQDARKNLEISLVENSFYDGLSHVSLRKKRTA